MQVNLPSLQKNDFILSLMFIIITKKTSVWPLAIMFLTIKQNYLKHYLAFFSVIINGRFLTFFLWCSLNYTELFGSNVLHSACGSRGQCEVSL